MKFVFFLPIQIKMQLLREIVHPKLKRREKIRTELFAFLNYISQCMLCVVCCLYNVRPSYGGVLAVDHSLT